MSAEDLDLTNTKSLFALLSRTKNGLPAVDLATKLGIWTEAAHKNPSPRVGFVRDLSSLTPSQLSDSVGAWTAEYGRILELMGLLSGQESVIKIQIKSALAGARSRIRNNQPKEAKPYTNTQLNDLAEEDQSVIDLYEQSALISLLSAHVSASKEATAQYLASLSREIAWRDAQIKGKLY